MIGLIAAGLLSFLMGLAVAVYFLLIYVFSLVIHVLFLVGFHQDIPNWLAVALAVIVAAILFPSKQTKTIYVRNRS